MLFPYNSTIKKDRIIKGPKGIGSFLVFILSDNKITEIHAPKRKDKKIFNKISLIPRINPNVEIKVTSPPPIPPLDNMTIAKNKTPDIINPAKPFKKFIDSLYIE